MVTPVINLTPNADLSPEDAHEIAQAYDAAYTHARAFGPGPTQPKECNRLAVMAMLNKAEELGRVTIPTYLISDDVKPVQSGDKLLITLCHTCWKDQARHQVAVTINGIVTSTWTCCACYVAGGGAPADWHPGCMDAYRAKEAANAANNIVDNDRAVLDDLTEDELNRRLH